MSSMPIRDRVWRLDKQQCVTPEIVEMYKRLNVERAAKGIPPLDVPEPARRCKKRDEHGALGVHISGDVLLCCAKGCDYFEPAPVF